MAWKGYPILEASWEPEQVFSDDGNLTNVAINYEYAIIDHITLIDLREHDDGADMEIRQLLGLGKTGLEVF